MPVIVGIQNAEEDELKETVMKETVMSVTFSEFTDIFIFVGINSCAVSNLRLS